MKLVDIDKLIKAARDGQMLIEQNRGVVDKARNNADFAMLNVARAIERNSFLQRMLEDAECHRASMRVVEGPLAELQRAGVFNSSSPLLLELQKTQKMMAEFRERFTLPEIGLAASLVEEFQQGGTAGILQRFSGHSAGLMKAMESMRTPWLDAQQMFKSVSGFAELQGIGSILTRLPTFDDMVSDTLRVDLGDWRDPIAWPKNVLTDLGARSEFYLGLGFDPCLTDFPAPAFQEGVKIAGLLSEPPPIVVAYGPPTPQSDNYEEEKALVRTNVAHDWLMRLETCLRQFIDLQMTIAFGSDWPKHRLPKDLYEKWQEKKRDAEESGRGTWPLVAYADFTDYERVICKKDNWREVFGDHFRRPESVRETLQRLYPIRMDTMHARPIAQDDELLLYVEVQRLVRVIVV